MQFLLRELGWMQLTFLNPALDVGQRTQIAIAQGAYTLFVATEFILTSSEFLYR